MEQDKLLSNEEVDQFRFQGLDRHHLEAIIQFFINVTGQQPSDLSALEIRKMIASHRKDYARDH